MTLDRFIVLVAQAADPAATQERGMSLLDFIQAGGLVGYIIILLSAGAVALGVMQALEVREQSLAPAKVVDDLHNLLGRRQVGQAAEYCEKPENGCFLTNVIGAGLSRYRRSAFGALELKGALEEAGQEQVARLYRKTDGLALIAGIAPMLGLLGTVIGLYGAFGTISDAGGFARPDQIARDVSLALVTTILGLVVAIPVSAAVTYFRNRIDAVASTIAAIVDDLAAHLEDRSTGDAGRSARAGAALNPAEAAR